MSWLEQYSEPNDNIHTVLCSVGRRALVYPYLRHWGLARKVLADVAKVLYLGKRCILKVLLSARGIMEHTDTHYMLNKVFLDDYCVWLQSVDESTIDTLAKEFNEAKTMLEKGDLMGKSSLGLCLPELETWFETVTQVRLSIGVIELWGLG